MTVEQLNSRCDAAEEKLTGRSRVTLPVVPYNVIDWIHNARPFVGGIERTFDWEPFWIEPYEDSHPNIVIKNARQTFKTTFGTDILGCHATAYPNREITCILDTDERLQAFSEKRLRHDTFLVNPILKTFLPYGRANIRRIVLLNGSVIYLRTDEGEYGKVEGLTNHLVVCDESQYQELQFLQKVFYTMTQTKGRLYLLGIGGESGSEWHKIWLRSDQRHWVFKDKFWREKLKFDVEGNLTNEHPSDVVAGRWVAEKPSNQEYRGYSMPQSIFARIPLTIQDATQLYRTRPSNSIEYQRKHYPSSMYLSHTLGDFYKAERRPITPEMIEDCYNYDLTLLTGDEVTEIKNTFGQQVRILGGVDFGSSPAASSTYVTTIIHWRKVGRYQLVGISQRPQEHGLDQSAAITAIGKSYSWDIGVGDVGYGQDRVKNIQDGAVDSRKRPFTGLGQRFVGCRTIGSEVKPDLQFKEETDEHGTELGRIQIDKTTTIQAFVDFIGMHIPHPIYPESEKLSRTKFLIPMKNDWETDFLMADLTATTRKDIDQEDDRSVEDPRQKAVKLFNHPRDSMMSIIYCLVGDNNYDEAAFHISRGVSRKIL